MKKDYVKVRVADLKPYENNPRNNKDAVKYVKESINQVGYISPIVVDENMEVLAGHTRLAALSETNITEVDVLVIDGLTDEQKKKYRILDNQTGTFATFDLDKLAEELEGLDFGGFDFGFDCEIDLEQKDVIEDNYEEPEDIEPIAKYGDIWALGRHRVMCGDSTSVDDLECLLDGKLADCVLTDPPYNMNYSGAGNTPKDKRRKILNDSMPEHEFKKFLTDVYVNMFCGMKEGATCYVFYKELGSGTFITAMEQGGITFKQELIWVKDHLVIGGGKISKHIRTMPHGV